MHLSESQSRLLAAKFNASVKGGAIALDPYMIWAGLTRLKGLAEPINDSSPVQIAAVLKCGTTEKMRESLRSMGFRIDPTKLDVRHTTAQLTCSDFFEQVLRHPSIERVELCQPLADGSFEFRPTWGLPPKKPVLDRLVLAVIDDGFAFAHKAFRQWRPITGWHSRVAYLWDQGARVDSTAQIKKPWRIPPDFAYGLEIGLPFEQPDLVLDKVASSMPSDAHPIDDLLAACARPDGSIDEDACYRAAGYSDHVASSLTHGTHVLDLFAGYPNPLVAPNRACTDDAAGLTDQIIFVQLPRSTVLDTSGASMSLFVIDALRYVLNRVDKSAQLVVNLSYGSMAGPHDGTSILESAIDEMLMQRKNFSVVLPAGNFYKSSCHATVKLSDSRPSGKLKLQVRADDPTDTFVELWWPCVADNLRMPEVLISVQPPGAAPSSGKVASGNVRIWDGEQRWLDLGGAVLPEPACSVLRLPKTVLSTRNSAMALIALSPTRAGRVERPLAPHGVWEVTVEFGSSHQVELVIDAWIERDDQALGSRRSRSQAVFLDDHEPDAPEVAGGRARIDRCNTMSNITCGAQPVIVGGCVLDGTELSEYTSSGPGCGGVRSSGPDVVAPSDESSTLSGLLAAGTRSETWVRMGGTSVAAPIVARRLANILAARDAAGESPVTSDQLKELLLKEVEPHEPKLPAGPELPVRRGGGFLRGEC